jgi:transposase
MTHQRQWYAGVDWGSESHNVVLTDSDGRKIGEKVFGHGGEGLAAMAAWLMAASGAAEASQILVAIEVPHGPVVETLMERGFTVHSINPKQMDRFRDRFSPAGAKDDSRDSEVMASALRTDPQCLRQLAVADPVIIELREWSRIAEELGAERVRLTNRMREQLWRYFPAILELGDDLGRSGCSICGKPRRRPPRPRVSARRPSPRYSSAIASAASMPPMCSASCASHLSRSQPAPRKLPWRTSPRSLHACACSTGSSGKPITSSTP